MVHTLEKALLGCLEKEQHADGVYKRQTVIIKLMEEKGFRQQQVLTLISDLTKEGCIERLSRKAENVSRNEIVIRLTSEGWHRRSEIEMYMKSIEFKKVDYNPSDPGKSIWWEVLVSGVMWGKFHDRYAKNIKNHLFEITHSLCLSRRSNKEIIEAIRTRFTHTTRVY